MHVFMDIHDYIGQTKKISQMCMLACMFIREKRERGRGTEGGREGEKEGERKRESVYCNEIIPIREPQKMVCALIVLICKFSLVKVF